MDTAMLSFPTTGRACIMIKSPRSSMGPAT
jgi:hypothetical protein